jgi:BlaI family penicillinase repressor
MASTKRGGPPRRSPPELTEAEWIIIKAVWQLEPVAAPAVQEALVRQTAWTYSTVKTLMDRMVEKGLLSTQRIRNLTLYRASVTQVQARRSEVMRAVRRAFDGAMAPMMHFLLERSDLSHEDLDEMQRLIREKRSGRSSDK